MKVTYPLCRGLGHHWDPYEVDEFPAVLVVRVKCGHCGMIRKFTMTWGGVLVKPSTYPSRPADYRMVGYAGRQSEVRAAARSMLVDVLGAKRASKRKTRGRVA